MKPQPNIDTACAYNLQRCMTKLTKFPNVVQSGRHNNDMGFS